MSNQQLSIEAFKLFRKGRIFSAWELDQKSQTLNEEITFQQWFYYNKKRSDDFNRMEKDEYLKYLKFNN
jgi:hypothetical protein